MATIYHGSKNIIKSPKYGKGNIFNDYGLAFYTTEDINLAKEWSVERNRSGYANEYEIDFSDFDVLNLNDEKYSILNWLAILIDNRIFEIQTDFGQEALAYLKEYFLLDYKSADVIVGYRADDSYFSFAQDFINNTISINTLKAAMKLGQLGTQMAIKSEKAFNALEFKGYEFADFREWYPLKEIRDTAARRKYSEMRQKPWKRGEIYIMNIIDEEIKPDDVRLR